MRGILCYHGNGISCYHGNGMVIQCFYILNETWTSIVSGFVSACVGGL